MAATDSKEMDRLAMAATGQPGSEQLWPNPNWSQEAAMIAYRIHQLDLLSSEQRLQSDKVYCECSLCGEGWWMTSPGAYCPRCGVGENSGG